MRCAVRCRLDVQEVELVVVAEERRLDAHRGPESRGRGVLRLERVLVLSSKDVEVSVEQDARARATAARLDQLRSFLKCQRK